MKNNGKMIKKVTIFATIIFILMLLLVKTGVVENNDLLVKEIIENVRTKNLNIFFVVITNLGSTIPVIVIVLGMVLHILFKNKNKEDSNIKDIMFMTITLGVSAGLFVLIKQIIKRPRPEMLDSVIIQGGYSFPSGHSAVAMTVYLTLMILFGKYIKNIKTRKVINVLCSLIIILIGFSRIYLGVHYLSDIIAGFALGIVSTLTCYRIIYGEKKGVKDGENRK